MGNKGIYVYWIRLLLDPGAAIGTLSDRQRSHCRKVRRFASSSLRAIGNWYV